MRLTESDARDLCARAFRHAGVGAAAAEETANILTLAEMMGIGTHGLSRTADYVGRIRAGGIDPVATPLVASPSPALRLVDARGGLGPAAAHGALSAAMDAARSAGIGAAFVRNGNHIGALAPYLWIATEAGFACIVSTNTAPMIAPAGGRAPKIGNNPLGIGLPFPGGTPVLLDMALSVAARSRIRAAAKAGDPIPREWATDETGQPTTDPVLAMRGLLRAIGGDKGANLALCLDLMTGLLSGSAILSEIPNAAETPQAPQNLGQMIVVLDVSKLMDGEALTRRMSDATAAIASTPAVPQGEPVRMPGARAVAALRDARLHGLKLPDALLDDLHRLAG